MSVIHSDEVPDELRREVKDIGTRIQEGSNAPHLDWFSKEGFDTLQREWFRYLDDLTLTSYRIAQRHRAPQVSETYVRQAARHLVRSASSFWRKLALFSGGSLLGLGVTIIVDIVRTGSADGVESVLVAIFVGVGSATSVWGLGDE